MKTILGQKRKFLIGIKNNSDLIKIDLMQKRDYMIQLLEEKRNNY